jgi:threonine/homoserine/homoserine lactone efflux protein
MSLTPLFLKALGIGVAVAAPVGPMSMLCMRRTLAQGWKQGMAVGLGIAAGDGAYGLVAALGLAGVSAFMLSWQKPLHLAAGIVLLWLGLRTFRAASKAGGEDTVQARTGGWLATFASALLLTLTNPMTIVMFAAVLAALAPKSGMSLGGGLATVAGVFLGSLLWWCAVVGAVSLFRHAIGPRARAWIDRAAGVFLGVFGLLELRRAL